MVRPWKPPSAATRWVRPVRRVSLSAASLASAPELVKKTLPAPAPSSDEQPLGEARSGARWRRSWRRGRGSPAGRSPPRPAPGGRGPSALTAMPPSRSTYSLPSASQTCAPSPRTRVSLGGPKVFIRLRRRTRSWKLGHDGRLLRRPGLAGLGLDAGQHLGADALLGEQLEQDGVRLAAVDDRGPGHAALDRVEAGLHLRHHAALEAGQDLGERLGADLADHVVASSASRGRAPRRR